MKGVCAITTVFFLSLFSITAKAQTLKEHKQVLLTGDVIYYTTQYDVVSGIFRVNNRIDNNDLVQGNYVEGERKGIWYFFNYDKTLFLRYNYDVNKIMFIDNKALANIEVKILTDDKDAQTNASVPVPLWSFDNFYMLSTENAKKAIDNDHRKRLKNRDLKIKVLIDIAGQAKYYVMYNLNNTSYQKEFTINDKMLDIRWLPSTFKDARHPSEVVFLTRINETVNESESGHRRINWSK
ncbi:MAG: hypothetical protein QM727_08660 [Niabella sp.]